MRTKLCCLLFALALSLAVRAQTPTQVKSLFLANQSRYDITFDNTVQGQGIVLYFYFGTNQWRVGPICGGNPFCDWDIFDSQGNQFVPMNRDNEKLLYVPASKGGPETITLVALGGQNLSFVAMVFPVSLIMQDAVTPYCPNIPLCLPAWSSSYSGVGTDNSSVISSYPLISSVANELFIGIGGCGTQCHGGLDLIFTPADGWSAPVGVGDVFMSYATVATVGTRETYTLFVSPALPEGQYAYMGINGFKTFPVN